MDTSPQPPFFHAKACFTWSPNRNYRVFLDPDELLLVEAGANGSQTQAYAAAHGLLGALIGAWIASRQKKKAAQLRARLDGLSVDGLRERAEEQGNLRVPVADFSEVRIEPPSFWHGVKYSNSTHAGIIYCQVHGKKYTLELPTVEDMKIAVAALPKLLPDVVVNAVWSVTKYKFVKKTWQGAMLDQPVPTSTHHL